MDLRLRRWQARAQSNFRASKPVLSGTVSPPYRYRGGPSRCGSGPSPVAVLCVRCRGTTRSGLGLGVGAAAGEESGERLRRDPDLSGRAGEGLGAPDPGGEPPSLPRPIDPLQAAEPLDHACPVRALNSVLARSVLRVVLGVDGSLSCTSTLSEKCDLGRNVDGRP